MKTNLRPNRRTLSGYALFMVLGITAVSFIVLASTSQRTYTLSKLNDRHAELMMCQNAAEASVEAVFAKMQYDFQSAGGPGTVTNSLNSIHYRGYIPRSTNDAYWARFIFSDGQGNNGKTYVNQIAQYTGQLPQAYEGRYTANAPVYRILSNAKLASGGNGVIGTAQQDVLLALVPLTAYAIFYNDLLEFSTCATMVVNGPVHCNTNIYVGAGSGATLTFNTTVTSAGLITAPRNNGTTWTGPTNYNTSNWRTRFNGTPKFINNVPTIQIPIPMTNTYSLLEMPLSNNYASTIDQQRLYNKAAVIILVSNTSVTTIIQKSPTAAGLPAEDPSKVVLRYTNLVASSLITNLPFLSISNRFYDRREDKTAWVTQVDIGKYSQWLNSNPNVSGVSGKYPSGSGNYPTILYVADNRTTNGLLFGVRLTNGIAPPSNGGQGFTVATPNPLYVQGHYNSPSAQGTTNTFAAGTVPAALMADSLTILSSQWRDSLSSGSYTSRDAVDTTINAAILTGIVPSTGNGNTEFSGGVHNLPRLLEDWNSDDQVLTINTSMINLFRSRKATGEFLNPGTYYDPPTRRFSYDLKFKDPAQTPPGIPCALVALRFGWATPPPNTLTYNVAP
ncbi:MAG TPA: hypothetical protein VEH04_03170 [Verrucomicrobiae bacterium]|nr:hypothetical protein [Verrucomicrobiae bacterium]